jgi:hypothetical protein
MGIVDKHTDDIIRLVTQEAEKFRATVKEINIEKQILDIDCPDENKHECAVAIQKILDEYIS